MTRSKILSLLLSIVIIIGMLPMATLAADNDKTMRSVYLHAQGENPQTTTNSSTVYIGENADIYFAFVVFLPVRRFAIKSRIRHIKAEARVYFSAICQGFDKK